MMTFRPRCWPFTDGQKKTASLAFPVFWGHFNGLMKAVFGPIGSRKLFLNDMPKLFSIPAHLGEPTFWVEAA